MTVAHHALEVTLTRPLTAAELHHAARLLPLATNHDATRLMTLVRAKTPGRAAHRLRHCVGARLPVDVITTHYPDTDGQILLNIDFPPSVHAAICDTAHRTGQPPELFVRHAIHRALDRHAGAEAARLDQAIQDLLAGALPAHLLAAVGRALTHIPGASQ
ncbi:MULTISPECIES: hypothetical protein [unclassified Streptomyces]|uniref:hypothetical protein n=1 Tax=unclassified Streptomyces TaxID=2593676 RepID=UPI000F712413|nr:MULTISPECIES: hypothetical protein [unclassified Streptomyces]AZM58151.1 hypothetical protein DLM49_00040 [Streptomyces sp. WAC 01438]RSM99048.1 hypothetical protein DMA10_07995 [Streptomyces sp. WAC 01420]